MSQKLKGVRRFVWWHRLKGHTVHKGYGLLAPMSAYHCEECELTWTRSLL